MSRFDGGRLCETCGIYSDCLLSPCPVCNKPITNPDEDDNGNLRNECIFRCDAKPLTRDSIGETSLHKLCREGKIYEVEQLLELKKNPNIQNNAGSTALHEAVKAQNLHIVQLLLKYGALPSVPGYKYATPLHEAIYKKNINIIKLLIEYGAAKTCLDWYGQTPYYLCRYNDDLIRAVSLTASRPSLTKIYHLVLRSTVFLINVDGENEAKLLKCSNVTISQLDSFLIEGNVTYLIIGANGMVDPMYLQAAILQGALVFSENWIPTLVGEVAAHPMDFVMNFSGYDLLKAAINVFQRQPKLFDGLRFYFYHNESQEIDGCVYTFQDFNILIKLGGGEVITSCPDCRRVSDIYFPYHARKQFESGLITYYFIYDERKPPILEDNGPTMRNKSGRWLIERIKKFSFEEISNF